MKETKSQEEKNFLRYFSMTLNVVFLIKHYALREKSVS